MLAWVCPAPIMRTGASVGSAASMKAFHPRALTDTLREVLSLCEEHRQAASLNVVLSNAEATVAARCARGVPANSLYTSTREQGLLIASEAMDAPEQWAPVPDGSVIELKGGTVTVQPLNPPSEPQ